MSFFRKSLFWLIALVVLGGAFFLFNERDEQALILRQADLRLFSFQPAEVTEFWIRKQETGLLIRVVSGAEGWRLQEPLAVPGDQEAIGKMLENVVNARKDAVLFEAPDPAKLKELGFDEPSLEMEFRTAGGTTLIRFGGIGPTNNVAYAMLDGDPKVYRIHADVRQEVDTSVYALRDKTVLAFDPAKLRRLTLERKGMDRLTVLHDDRGRWDMTEPERTRASMAHVLETLYGIKNAEVKDFVDEAPATLAPYGLDDPRIRVSILEQGQQEAWVLSIGAKDRTRRGYFAKTDREARVFVVEEDMVNGLLADKANWRDQDSGT